MSHAWYIYKQSNGSITTAYYRQLESLGPVGVVAMNLFRAQKTSSRAKKYRGGIPGKGSYRDMSYERKNWSLKNLCDALMLHGSDLGISFGWKIDPAQSFHKLVLYVDLPTGQCSFHSETRRVGPDYPGEWDGLKASAERILAFCDSLFEGQAKEQTVAEVGDGA